MIDQYIQLYLNFKTTSFAKFRQHYK